MSYLDNSDNLQEVRELYLKRLLKPKLTSERAKLITESYKETQMEPIIIRRAKALRKILSEMTIYIKPWELIAGNLGPEPVSAPIFPEGGVDFILDELDTYETREGDKFDVSETVKNELREILPWWNGKTLKDYGFNLMPAWVRKQSEAGLFKAENMLTCGTGHFLPDYRKILHWGFEAIERYSKDRLDSLPLTDIANMEKRLFYEACLIICEGMRIFASRYAKLAEEMALSEPNAERKKELTIIADACKKIPMKPATNFFEALQSIWFTHVINYIDSNGYGVTLGRTARDLYPFYKESLEKGETTRDQAGTYLTGFMFKCNDILKLYNNTAAKLYGGFPVGEPIQLGGLGTDGNDDTNEVSELFLEAEEKVRLYQPDIGILWTNKMKDDFLLKAVNLVSTSHKPKFFNYHVGGEMYLRAGIPMEEARTNWGFIGCVELGIPGKMWTWADAAVFNLAKCLELTLNNGADFQTGEKIGLVTGEDITECSSFAHLMNTFNKQVSHALKLLAQGIIALQIAHKEVWPEPYQSMLVDGCLERGCEANSGGAQYYQTGVQFIGFATVVDSLMAIKKFVFENKEISMADLVSALRNNFKDNEILRQKLLNETPKFGNDIDEVDGLACEVCSYCCDEISQHKDIWNTPFTASFYTVTSHIAFGNFVGATPDGRLSYTPLSDATSPVQGAIKNGATAVLKSEAKLPHYKATNGTLLNMKFNKQLLRTEEGLNYLASLIKAYFTMGGFHVQFNVVDVETLRDAQKHPEKYTDFLVRVAAYVTNWNQLSKQIQDEIISRTELEAF
jgi:formate C-acetyltransferase